jgi:hypothetical protein
MMAQEYAETHSGLRSHLIKCIHSVCLTVSCTIIELETTHRHDQIIFILEKTVFFPHFRAQLATI